MANGTKPIDDFVPVSEFKETKETVDKLKHPDQFAEVFCYAAKSQTSIHKVLEEIICDNIKTNKEIHETNKKMFAEIIKEDKTLFFKTTLDKFKHICSIIGGVILTLIVQWLLKKFELN